MNVRFLVEGEEEVGSVSLLSYLRDQPPEADCVIVFDSLMADERTPAINTGARGLVQGPVEVRTGRRDLHSGLYGGAVLNATHVLMGILEEVLPGPDGRVREELRAGVVNPSDGGARVVGASPQRRRDDRRGGRGGGRRRARPTSSGSAPAPSPPST